MLWQAQKEEAQSELYQHLEHDHLLYSDFSLYSISRYNCPDNLGDSLQYDVPLLCGACLTGYYNHDQHRVLNLLHLRLQTQDHAKG